MDTFGVILYGGFDACVMLLSNTPEFDLHDIYKENEHFL